MSDFKKFRALLQDHFNEMVKSGNPLFITDADEDELYNLYLDSFPAGTNELFRKRREYDCSCCRRFVKNIGKLVAFDKNYNLISIWDFDAKSAKYQPVVNALATYVKSRAILCCGGWVPLGEYEIIEDYNGFEYVEESLMEGLR